MNSEMGAFLSSKLRRLRALVRCLTDNPRGSSPLRRIFTPQTSHEGGGVKRALHLPNQKLLPPPHLISGLAFWFFLNSDQLLTDVGPVELWATH
jgi:hypothetical protein